MTATTQTAGNGASPDQHATIGQTLAHTSAPAPARRAPDIEGALRYDLLPILDAQELLTKCLRVLAALDNYADHDGDGPEQLARLLSQACPTWRDPLARGDEWEVVAELSRAAAGLGLRIVGRDE